MGKLLRLDQILVQRGLAQSRARAVELVEQGRVKVNGFVATRAGAQFDGGVSVVLDAQDFPWVSRGALKLIDALEKLPVEIAGKICADFGSSTGGFTEILLHHGAAKVYAIDVGKGQLAWKLRTDPRVVVMEGVNARHLEGLPDPIDLVVGDLSFIGLGLILGPMAQVMGPGAQALVLVKPQFEVGPDKIGKGGKVRSEDDRLAAIAAVQADAQAQGFVVTGSADCGVAGARAGNVEHFLRMSRPAPPGPPPG